VLFIDARHIFRQVDRAHRKFSPKQIEYIANIVRLYREENPEFTAGDDADYPGPDANLKETFPKLKYADDEAHELEERIAGNVAKLLEGST
jgi:type I restriction enzyme M protein